MQILRARLGFAALQMFPEENRMRFQVLFLELGREEGSHRDFYSGTPTTLIRKAFCLGVRCGLYLIATG